jgi:hypothetical protein
MVKTIGCSSKRLGDTNKRLGYTNVPRQNKEKAHRYKQRVEKAYILHRLKNNEQKVKQNEKIQEVH